MSVANYPAKSFTWARRWTVFASPWLAALLIHGAFAGWLCYWNQLLTPPSYGMLGGDGGDQGGGLASRGTLDGDMAPRLVEFSIDKPGKAEISDDVPTTAGDEEATPADNGVTQQHDSHQIKLIPQRRLDDALPLPVKTPTLANLARQPTPDTAADAPAKAVSETQPRGNPLATMFRAPTLNPGAGSTAGTSSGTGSGGKPDGNPRGYLNPEPPYPPQARAAGQQGTVVLIIDIDATGHVTTARIEKSSGFDLLDQSCLGAIHRWRFYPATRGGQPVDCTFRKSFTFHLE